jgi:hypothetical protein
MDVHLHDVRICGLILAASRTIARFAAAELALAVLVDPTRDESLARICGCIQLKQDLTEKEVMNVDETGNVGNDITMLAMDGLMI